VTNVTGNNNIVMAPNDDRTVHKEERVVGNISGDVGGKIMLGDQGQNNQPKADVHSETRVAGNIAGNVGGDICFGNIS